MNKQEIIELLSNNVCEVTFTKVNGDVRVMPCTLRADVLPPVTVTEGKEKKTNDAVISAWVTDIDSWRSFRVENVTDIKVLSE